MNNLDKLNADNKVVIVVPALNEEKTITDVINKASKTAPVLVVDDGSTDKTSLVAEAAGAIVLKLPKNLGVDGALAAGFQKACDLGYDIVATIDADGQHDPSLLESIIEPVRSGQVIMCHSARVDYVRFSEWILRKYSYWSHGYKDILSGLKCFRLEIFKANSEMAAQKTLGTAIPWLAMKSGGKIKEVEITVNDREDEPRIGGYFKANFRVLKALVRLIYWDLFKR